MASSAREPWRRRDVGGAPAASTRSGAGSAASALAVQRMAGNRALTQTLARKRKPSPQRARAEKLGAWNAENAIQGSLPDVFPLLKPADVEKIQKVYDSFVINPDVDERAARIWQQSWFRMGDRVHQDERQVAEYHKVRGERIKLGDDDRRVRIDPEKLLASDAFKRLLPDNADEQAFVVALADRFDTEGLWLQLREDRRIGPDAGYWQKPVLTIGKDGPRIPTPTGRIDHAALMATYGIRDMRERMLASGPASTALKKALQQLQAVISSGKDEHERLEKARHDSSDLAVYWSDKAGGAKFPSALIWSEVDKAHHRAWKLWGEDKIVDAYAAGAVAARLTELANQRIADEMNKSMKGAGRVVTGLAAVAAAGTVAELFMLGPAGGLARLAARKAGGKLAQKVAKEVGKDAMQEAGERAVRQLPKELADELAKTPMGYVKQGARAANRPVRPYGAPKIKKQWR